MDSPESNRIVSTSASPAAVQDSPIFCYLSNLSPIKPVKAVHAAQRYSELNFLPPPPVFTSPRINLKRGNSFLKRPQLSCSSNAEFSSHDDRSNISATASDISVPSATKSMVELIPFSPKECDSKCSVQVQPCSPLGSVSEYLSDPVEVDSVNSVDSADLCLGQSNVDSQALQSTCSSSKGIIAKLDNDVDVREGTDTKVAASLTSLEQAEEGMLEKSMFSANSVETEADQQKDGERLSSKCSGVMSEEVNALVESVLSREPASGSQNGENVVTQVATDSSSLGSKKKEHEDADSDKKKCTFSTSLCHHSSQDAKLQNAEAGQQDEWECSPQLLPESIEITRVYDGRDENSGAISNGSVENRMEYDFEEASQHQRTALRRCLLFEAAEAHRSIVGNSHKGNSTNITTNLSITATHTDLEVQDSCHLESSAASSVKQPVNLSQPITLRLSLCSVTNSKTCIEEVDKSVLDCRNASITTSVPSGIGLHLNSIVNAVEIGSSVNASMKLSEKNCPRLQVEKLPSVINHHLPEYSKSFLISTSMVGKFSANTDIDLQESEAILVASSSTPQSPHSMKPLKNSLPLKLVEHHMTPCNKRKSLSENADRFEEFNQPSPKKKRKRATYINEAEGCKRCNCKRSKCLKLYCECFAAGLYCAKPCACQECFNKPEYEDAVLETRQQIESRNPLAFAPKIIQHVTESPTNSGEDGNRRTPSSARHKRGCNCKKSMCLKKYCECYQAGVGCSDGCRCEGCKNIFGMKEGYGEITQMVYKRADDERLEGPSDEKLDMVETSSILHLEQCHPDNLSPLTPSFLHSNHGEDMLKSRVHARSRRYLSSLQSDTSVPSSYGKSPKSPRKSNSNERLQKTSRESSDIVPYDHELDCIKAGGVGQISPRWDGLADICNLTPLPHPPLRAMASSASSNVRDCTKVSRVQLCHGSSHLLSDGSLRWHSSPITPMSRLVVSKFLKEPDSDGGLYDILEDDTPEILKDTPTPIKTVKASSPNQKRVSPPHSRLHELRSSSSSGLRSVRRFILQAVPSFPSLTPYSDLKGGSSDK